MKNDQRTIIVDNYRKAARLQVNNNSYKGLRIHALPGLHDFIAKKAFEYFCPQARLLDLAAGSGAMSLRMSDLGFNVTATDYVSENFKLDSVPFIKLDLNNDFSDIYPQKFQAIVASEIIEHLENPRHFARQCYSLLEVGARLILSTPNLNNPASFASFVRSGRFLWFGDVDYEVQGHITPITQWQIDKSFSEAGFKSIWRGSFGEGHSLAAGSPRLIMLSKLLSKLSGSDPDLSGEIYVIIFEKK